MEAVFLDKRVEKEFKALPADMRVHFVKTLNLMEIRGEHNIGLPHVRKIQPPLWEIRMKGKDGIARALYVTKKEGQLLVLHIFVKKTEKTPHQAIDLALKRLKEVM